MVGASPRYLNADGYVGGFMQENLGQMYQEIKSSFETWAKKTAAFATREAPSASNTTEFEVSIKTMRPDVALTIAQGIFQADFREQVGTLPLPVLVIQGSDDPFVPACVGEYLANTIPDAKLVTIQCKGHFPQLSSPEAVTKAIQGFLLAK